jgi:hypothetical protein
MSKYQKYDISYQLGAYYDMRYMQYITRCKFILGLSRYNEDDTAFEREEEMKVVEKVDKNISVLDWKINKTKLERRERDDDLVDNTVIQICGEMARYIQKDNPYDKVVDEFLLNTYTNIDEQELQVCKTVIWAIWDISTPYYFEVVARILNSSRIKRSKIFSDIKKVEDTIQRLIHKGILSQSINYVGNRDKNGDIRWRYDEPHIILSFAKDPAEALKAISEIFVLMCKSFFGPSIDYSEASSLE